MGCDWVFLARERQLPDDHMAQEIALLLEHWEQVMSTWRHDSDISRFNRGEKMSSALQSILARAEEIKGASGGAFDTQVLAAVHRAGFAPAGNGHDLSAIGKGYAVDRVAERLRALGYRDFLFQLAGETIAGDQPWQVALEQPDPTARRIGRTIALCREALATSGNYRQFVYDKKGQIRSHLIDPRTGLPVQRPFSAVSVIAPDAATADAWATACFVLGPEAKPSEVRVIWQFDPPQP